MINSVQNLDALEFLKSLPDNFVHCCVTSPPYYNLRNYTDGDKREIGRESSPEEYVKRMVEVFSELRRVLRPDGTFWLNIGDSYAANRSYQVRDSKNRDVGNNMPSKIPAGLKQKDLIGIPWMLAFALRSEGWYLRSEIIWEKGNALPESVKDRPTKSHEQLFLLSKCPRYYYDSEAIKEPVADSTPARMKRGVGNSHKYSEGSPGQSNQAIHSFRNGDKSRESSLKRNKRTVWRVNTKGFKGAHFAVFPEKLVEPCVLAGCPEFVCSNCGKPHIRMVETTTRSYAKSENGANDGTNNKAPYKQNNPHNMRLTKHEIATDRTGNVAYSDSLHKKAYVESETLGFSPSCICGGSVTSGIVIDPFGGSGTVAVVARKNGRFFVINDLNKEFQQMAVRRIESVQPRIPGV